MRLLLAVVVNLLVLACSSSAFAQFTPLCDDGMGGYKPCVGTLNVTHLPVVPISKGGTSATSGIPYGRYFGGRDSSPPGFILIDRRHVPGMSVDMTVNPAPLIEITKTVGGPQELLRFPARSGTQNRIYSDQDGFYLTMNAKPGPVGTWDKEITSETSAVMQFSAVRGVSFLADGNSGVSRWLESAPQVSMKLSGGKWITSSKSPQISVAGGTVCGGASGDIYPFPVQWPVPYEVAPASVTYGSDIVSSGTNIASINGVSRYGAVLNVRRVTSDPCVSWVGYVSASN